MTDKQATDEMVYCFAAPDERIYEQAEAAYRRWWRRDRETHLGHRDQYPASGWTMPELVGSQWISLHTCTISTVTGVDQDHWNHPRAIFNDDGHLGLGLWWNNRFVVDDWVRFDVLNPDEKFSWYAAAVCIANRNMSCEAGEGHAYPEPTIRFHGGPGEGWKALCIAYNYGLPVSVLRRIWVVVDGEITGPEWEIVFTKKAEVAVEDVRVRCSHDHQP